MNHETVSFAFADVIVFAVFDRGGALLFVHVYERKLDQRELAAPQFNRTNDFTFPL